MPEDPWKERADVNSFGYRGDIVTPGNNDLDPIPKAIVCLSFGDITVIPAGNPNNAPIPFSGCGVGFMPPYRVRRVTSATGLWATVY